MGLGEDLTLWLPKPSVICHTPVNIGTDTTAQCEYRMASPILMVACPNVNSEAQCSQSSEDICN